MFKKLLSVSFTSILFLVGCSVFANEVSEILPVYPPRVQIIGDDGKMYTKRKELIHELKNMSLIVEKDSASPTGYIIPKNISEANEKLRKALSDAVYIRLMSNYKEISTTGYSSKDLALDERFGDLAIFFNKAWDLSTNENLIKNAKSRKDYVERFEGLLDSLAEYNKKSH